MGRAKDTATNPTQTAVEGDPPAKNLGAINPDKEITSKETKAVTPNLIIVDANMYLFANLYFFLAIFEETKLIEPDDIPRSVKEIKITTKFVAAENIPKSLTDSALATTKVNKNPKKAERVLPKNNVKVSFAVPENIKNFNLFTYFFTIYIVT